MGFHSIFVERHALPSRDVKLSSLFFCSFCSSNSRLVLEKHRR
jgi:hypothetical protein